MDSAVTLELEWPWVVAVIGALFAGVVKGVSAGGFPLIATPLLALALGPRSAVLAISVPTLALNIWQSITGGQQWRVARRIVPLLIAEIVGLPLGVWLLVNLDQRALSLTIGVLVLLFVLYSLRFPKAALPAGRLTTGLGVVAGFAAGVMGGTTGFYGPPLTMYLVSLRLDKEDFVFLASVAYLIVSSAQVLIYMAAGLYRPESLLAGALLCLPAFIGFRVGVWLRSRIDDRLFFRLLIAVLVVSGLSLVLRPLLGG